MEEELSVCLKKEDDKKKKKALPFRLHTIVFFGGVGAEVSSSPNVLTDRVLAKLASFYPSSASFSLCLPSRPPSFLVRLEHGQLSCQWPAPLPALCPCWRFGPKDLLSERPHWTRTPGHMRSTYHWNKQHRPNKTQVEGSTQVWQSPFFFCFSLKPKDSQYSNFQANYPPPPHGHFSSFPLSVFFLFCSFLIKEA